MQHCLPPAIMHIVSSKHQNKENSNFTPLSFKKPIAILHAFCQLIDYLLYHKSPFRILALTATPCNTPLQLQVSEFLLNFLAKVHNIINCYHIQKLVKQLVIEKVEIRTEKSPDVIQYVYERKVQCVIILPSDRMKGYRSLIEAVRLKVFQIFIKIY